MAGGTKLNESLSSVLVVTSKFCSAKTMTRKLITVRYCPLHKLSILSSYHDFLFSKKKKGGFILSLLVMYYESEMEEKKTVFASLILRMRSTAYIQNKLS